MDAAVLYGSQAPVASPAASSREAVAVGATSTAGAVVPANRGASQERELSFTERIGRRAAAWFEIFRPFSFTASTVPVAVGGALAAVDGKFNWPLFLAAFFGGVLLHIGTNVLNEIYDIRQGVDTITTPRASHAILTGRVSEKEAFVIVGVTFLLALALGLWLFTQRGWPILILGLIGVVGGYGYTAPPLQLKFKALGLPLVFLLMGPLMVVGGYYAVTGEFSWNAVVASIPVGFLVAAILHGNEWRDITDDARAGISTLSIRYGRNAAHIGYVTLVVGAYMALALGVISGAVPTMALLAMLSLPLLVRAIRASELGASGQQRAIAMIDLQTAQLHAVFGSLLVAGLIIAAASVTLIR